MLTVDYKKLRGKFTSKLNEFGKEELLKWMEIDQNREVVDSLLHGGSAAIQYKKTTNKRV